MSEEKSIFMINILKNIISVYFDTFFVLYFFQVANYEVLPVAKYYITLYLFIVQWAYILWLLAFVSVVFVVTCVPPLAAVNHPANV